MEAVTDVVFRHVVAKAGRPDVFFTEFTNATGWDHAGDKAIGGRLLKTDDEHPIVAQIWGGEPDSMARLASHCRELGYDGIDINMGCPAKTAIKSGGAALIRQPELAVASIAAAKTTGLPVSVKTRLGYSSLDEMEPWLTTLFSQDISALTIHLRTKKEMSKVPAHHELISQIKHLRDTIAPQTKLIVNGDVRDREHGLALASKHTIDGIMIGRGIFQNPFAFTNVQPSQERLFGLLRYHLDLYDRYHIQTGRPFETLKRFFKIYVRDFDSASDIRVQLMNCTDTAQVRAILTSSTMCDSEI